MKRPAREWLRMLLTPAYAWPEERHNTWWPDRVAANYASPRIRAAFRRVYRTPALALGEMAFVDHKRMLAYGLTVTPRRRFVDMTGTS